jgi:hypothetical protein
VTPLWPGDDYSQPGDLLGCEDYAGHPEIPYGVAVPFKWVRTMLACAEASCFAAALQVELNMHVGSLELLHHDI